MMTCEGCDYYGRGDNGGGLMGRTAYWHVCWESPAPVFRRKRSDDVDAHKAPPRCSRHTERVRWESAMLNGMDEFRAMVADCCENRTYCDMRPGKECRWHVALSRLDALEE